MESDVAGDFHDLVDLKDGRAAVVIGDVAGVGLAAAEHADDLRAELSRLFRRTDDPAEALSLLDDCIERGSEEFYSTLACAVVDPASSRVVLASAGHPPIVMADGLETRFLEGTVGPPVGLKGVRRATTYSVDGDAALFLYTDGLVERRDRSLDDTLEVLLHAGRGMHGAVASAAELARRATARLGQPTDDATVVSVRMLTGGVRASLGTGPVASRARVVLRLYLDSRDLRSARTESIVNELALQARDEFDLVTEVVDVSQPGADTGRDGVLAAPSIVRVEPEPKVRVVGTVRSVAELAGALQLPLTEEDP